MLRVRGTGLRHNDPQQENSSRRPAYDGVREETDRLAEAQLAAMATTEGCLVLSVYGRNMSSSRHRGARRRTTRRRTARRRAPHATTRWWARGTAHASWRRARWSSPPTVALRGSAHTPRRRSAHTPRRRAWWVTAAPWRRTKSWRRTAHPWRRTAHPWWPAPKPWRRDRGRQLTLAWASEEATRTRRRREREPGLPRKRSAVAGEPPAPAGGTREPPAPAGGTGEPPPESRVQGHHRPQRPKLVGGHRHDRLQPSQAAQAAQAHACPTREAKRGGKHAPSNATEHARSANVNGRHQDNQPSQCVCVGVGSVNGRKSSHRTIPWDRHWVYRHTLDPLFLGPLLVVRPHILFMLPAVVVGLAHRCLDEMGRGWGHAVVQVGGWGAGR